MNQNHLVYIAVDNDEYELPFAVGDTIKEIADILGVSIRSVYRDLQNQELGIPSNHTYKIERVRMSSEAEDCRDLDIGANTSIIVNINYA